MPLANFYDKENYALLKNFSNKIIKLKVECQLFVGEMGEKKYQSSCREISKIEKDENKKAYFELLAEIFTPFKKVEYSTMLRFFLVFLGLSLN